MTPTIPRRQMRRPQPERAADPLSAALDALPLTESAAVPSYVWFLVGMFGGGLALVAATGSLLAWWIDPGCCAVNNRWRCHTPRLHSHLHEAVASGLGRWLPLRSFWPSRFGGGALSAFRPEASADSARTQGAPMLVRVVFVGTGATGS